MIKINPLNLEEYEKIPEGQIVRGPDLLKTLPLQTRLFDDASVTESQSSEEESQPFPDPVYDVVVESKRKAKKLFGKDLYTAFSFSPEFKRAMEDIKKDLVSKNPDLLKTESMVDESFKLLKAPRECPAVDDEESESQVKFLQFPDIDYEVEPGEEEIEEKKKEKDGGKEKKKKHAKIWQDDEMPFDNMSGYWRMLSAFDEFRISPPWYDAYAEGKQHWLQTKPLPPEVLENSRIKCLSWLGKHFDKKQK